MKKSSRTKEQLLSENEDLRRRLDESEETLRAIQEGEVDALVLSKPQGEIVFTLKGAEHPYRIFVEAMNEGAATLDPDGTILYCNNRFGEMLQIPAAKVIGSSIYRFIPSPDRSGFESAFQRGKQQDTTVDIFLKREDQELIPVHLSFNILSGQEMPVVCMVTLDLTEHKRLEDALRQLNADLEKRIQDRTAELRKINEALQAEIIERQQVEEALQASEEKHRLLVEHAPAGIYEIDFIERRFKTINEAACKMLGYTEAELLAMNPIDMLDQDSARIFLERLRKAQDGGTLTDFIEYKAKRKDGSEIWGVLHSNFKYSDGRIVGAFVVVHDITERKKAEEALRQSEERFEMSMEATNDGLWDWNIRTDEMYFSPAYFRMLGYEIGAFPGKGNSWKNLIHPDDRERALQANLDCIEGRRELFEVEFRMKARNDDWRWILGRGKCVARDGQGRALRLVGTHMDVTERKGMEEELRRSRYELESRVKERTEELAASHRRLQTLASQLLLAQEKERKRVAADLHDGLLSELSAMKFILEGKISLLEQGKLSNPGEFKRVSDILAIVIKETRAIMNNLHPSVLDELGLIPAIHWLSGEYEKTYPHIKVQKQIEVPEQEILEEVRIVIFRVLQEALNNFAKYGKGDRVDLSLSKANGALALTIQDNGQGFDLKNARKGLGLESMRERVDVSGGEFQMESAIGKGTTIRAIWTASIPYRISATDLLFLPPKIP